MSEAMPYADIIILGLVAVFILLRLRSVLGRKDEGEQDFFRPAPPPSAPAEPIIQLGAASLKPRAREEFDPYAAALESGALADQIAAIKSKDPQFTATAFMDGAKMAFEMVFDAFAKGDKQTLSMLLSPEIYEHFLADLTARDAQAHKTETTLLAVKAKEISRIAFDKNVARISVQFDSEQVTVERDDKGAIVAGDPSAVHHTQDEWVFERDVTSKNPNWKIIET